ncbi:MAG: TonB-dependent receptor [Gemmatimonadota bacterium]
MRLPRLAVLVMALAPVGVRAGAQTPTIVGVVRDSAGAPIASAEVSVMGRRASSDSLGRFYLSLPAADTMTISVRRLGYESVSFRVTAKDIASNSIDVVMHRVAIALDPVSVSGMEDRARTPIRGFDDRRHRGLGVFITREEIERRNTSLLTDVLRQSRGVVMRGSQVRFTNYQARNCGPMVWLDGNAAPGLDLSAVSAGDVEGIELYQSIATTPGEFRRGNQQSECGTIVIWTKRPILEVKRKP